MTKEGWILIYKQLSELYDELYFAMQIHNGKNKQKRDDAERKIDILIEHIRNILYQNCDVFNLVEFSDEFFSHQWIERDLKIFL